MKSTNSQIKSQIIKTRHFTLRPPHASDAPSIARHINDRTIARNLLTVPHPYTIDDAYEWLRKVRNSNRHKKLTRITFVIEIDSQAVGAIGLFAIAGHKAEIGYWLSRHYWGKGLMTQIVKETAKFGFGKLKLRRIYAYVLPYNPASMRVLEKAGFQLEGKIRKNVNKNGKILDEYLFSVVR